MAGEQLVSQTVAETVKWTDKVTAIIGVATLVLAVVGAVLAYRSYKQRTDEIAAQNKLDRFKNYLVANQVFETDKGILSVRNAAESGNWSTVSKDDRYDFMSFYEQLALMMQSGLISEDAVFYIYGYEFIRAYAEPAFWLDNDPINDRFWQLFTSFYKRMSAYNDKYKERPFPVENFTF